MRCGVPMPVKDDGTCLVCYWRDACRAMQDQRDRMLLEISELKEKLSLKQDG